jgi:hypothetical protein
MFDVPAQGTVSGSTAVFSRPIDGQADLWMVNLSTGEEKRLTDTPVFETNPKFCGDKVVFSTSPTANGQADLAMIDLEGSVTPLSTMPGDEGNFWVCGDEILWTLETPGNFSIWRRNMKTGINSQVRGASPEKPTNVMSNGKKIFWTQQDDQTDLDVWMYDIESGKSLAVCEEPGDQYCTSMEGNWVSIVGRYVFRPDRDLYVYDITRQMEVPVDTSREDVTSAVISNGHLVYILQPISTPIDGKLRYAKLGSDEISSMQIDRIPLTEKDRLHFSWPVVAWEDKRDCYAKGTDIWCFDFNTNQSFPASFDVGNQYLHDLRGSVMSWISTVSGKYSITFKILTY